MTSRTVWCLFVGVLENLVQCLCTHTRVRTALELPAPRSHMCDPSILLPTPHTSAPCGLCSLLQPWDRDNVKVFLVWHFVAAGFIASLLDAVLASGPAGVFPSATPGRLTN